ncbi:MAG: glucose-6-phosphate dehydrogenase [Acholeplasma sp.]|jgi:glucose-6-phosphate 1-dehydrogenase|nr:glucose-6-phosphate dehydrogenase [Acholeplasma sp.]
MRNIITIFGSTGDLTIRKLLPAIKRLLEEKLLEKDTLVLAIGRRDYQTVEYLDFVKKNSPHKFDVDFIAPNLEYFKLDIDALSDYQRLNEKIQSYGETRRVFYLAVGPDLLTSIASNIGLSNLVTKGDLNASITFEKPFGQDLISAREINGLLWQYFDEKQLYRIDHYLGKEMIQNILTVRFANKIFEGSWHNHAIKNVKIIAKETDTILSRAGYYDTSGALKDMVQSHLLQMLALVAMEVPLSYQSEDLKNEKVKVFDKLRYDRKSLVIGQYDGYLNEPNIDQNSKTETFVFLKAFVDTPRFKGVPFYLMTGKALEEKESVIIIEFEETPEQHKWDLPLKTNKLYIKIAPLDGISLTLNSKVPGLRNDVEQVDLEYCIACNAVGNMPEAYEKLILDMTEHHKSLFTRWDEIELSWQFIDKIKQDIKDKQIPLTIYKKPSDLYDLITEKEEAF